MRLVYRGTVSNPSQLKKERPFPSKQIFILQIDFFFFPPLTVN